MRLAIVACLLRSAAARQEDLLLLREDQCDDALFVAHWTHVPIEKAGLRGDEAVETELASSNLCGALDFSKVDDVCGRLETRDVLLARAAPARRSNGSMRCRERMRRIIGSEPGGSGIPFVMDLLQSEIHKAGKVLNVGKYSEYFVYNWVVNSGPGPESGYRSTG